MKDTKVIRNPDAFQLLADETRLKMVYLLRAKEMTVSQIAGELGLTPQTIYHHIKKLKEAEMVEVSREERIDHLVESYYRATAGVFHFVQGGCADEEGCAERVVKALKALGDLGFEVDASPSVVSKIVKLKETLGRYRGNPEFTDKIYEMDDIDPFTQNDVMEFAMMIGLSDRESEKYLDTQRTLRDSLLSQRKDRS
ncbi:MAG: metalloregulator ArsR/SmtB family transcription factor [Thermoplasmata archaeon]